MIDWNKESNRQLIKIIGGSIKARRLQQNITQEQLSKLSGVSLASVTRFETGKGNISLQNLFSILKTLNMADELKAVFSSPRASPALLAKATSRKTQERVRRSKKQVGVDTKVWTWGEDK